MLIPKCLPFIYYFIKVLQSDRSPINQKRSPLSHKQKAIAYNGLRLRPPKSPSRLPTVGGTPSPLNFAIIKAISYAGRFAIALP
ncbi:MAG: hypothetical protein HEQ35_13025 [Gloeotrichia echinulata IR180]